MFWLISRMLYSLSPLFPTYAIVKAESFQSACSTLKFQFMTYGVAIFRLTPKTGHGLSIPCAGTYAQLTLPGARFPKIGPPDFQLAEVCVSVKVAVVASILPGLGTVPFGPINCRPVGISANPCASVLFCPM